MPITPGLLRRVAKRTMHVVGGSRREDVTWSHRTAPNGAAVVSVVRLLLEGYSQHDIDMELILPTDLRGRIDRHTITWAPSRHDSFVRDDGTEWKVYAPTEGRNRLFWFVQCRQVA